MTNGDVRFTGTIEDPHESGKPWTMYGFYSSDDVIITNIFDTGHRPLAFQTTHEGNHYHYFVTLNQTSPAGQILRLMIEGSMTLESVAVAFKTGSEP